MNTPNIYIIPNSASVQDIFRHIHEPKTKLTGIVVMIEAITTTTKQWLSVVWEMVVSGLGADGGQLSRRSNLKNVFKHC